MVRSNGYCRNPNELSDPAYGATIFYLRAIAPREITYGHMAWGVMPFVAMLAVVLAIIGFVPATATYLPSVLFGF